MVDVLARGVHQNGTHRAAEGRYRADARFTLECRVRTREATGVRLHL